MKERDVRQGWSRELRRYMILKMHLKAKWPELAVCAQIHEGGGSLCALYKAYLSHPVMGSGTSLSSASQVHGARVSFS